MSYVAVASADDAVAKAKSLGGNAVMEPFDVMDYGRMAVLFDPQGAAFAVGEPKANIGLQIRDETNTLGWNELQARDVDAAKKFYAPLFGWTLKESPEYTEFHLGTRAMGGMMKSQAPEGVPSFWLPYFVVDDADATVAKSSASGGSVHVPPTDIPNVGRFAVLTDPQGASFAVIKLELQPKA
jgi:predicted enzyme related to lactoylglutathione lyase